jgi:hypothetical protein
MTPRLFALGRRKQRAKLAAIADAARYYDRPADCDGSDCFHDDDVCVNLETRYATTEDALAAARVPRLEADVDRLLKRTAKLGDLELAIGEALGLSASAGTDDLIAAVGRLKKLGEANGLNARFWADHFDEVQKANRQALGEHHKPGHTVAELITALVGQVDQYRELLGSIWLYISWRSVTRHLTTEQRELWAEAVESSGDPDERIAADRWWRDDAPAETGGAE